MLRSSSVEPAYSGWQFLCGETEEDPKHSQVWALHEVLKHEPTLRPSFGGRAGTVPYRASATDHWWTDFDETAGASIISDGIPSRDHLYPGWHTRNYISGSVGAAPDARTTKDVPPIESR
jgi:hypothetical protein